MKGFLYKDFLMSRLSLAVIAGMVLISAVTTVIISCFYQSDREAAQIISLVIVLMNFILTGMFDTGFFSFDENRLWQSFAASSPQSFKAQAQSKYLMILALNLFILFVFSIADAVCSLAAGVASGSITSAAFTLFSLQIIVCAVEIPFMVRFGAQKGLNVKFSAFMIVALAAVVYLLFGDISFIFEENVVLALSEFLQSSGIIWITSLLPYFASAVYFLSYKISAILYRKGAECYDN